MDCVCVALIHLRKLGHFLISFAGDCIIMMKTQINCAHVHRRAQPSDRLFYGRLNNSGQPDASRV